MLSVLRKNTQKEVSYNDLSSKDKKKVIVKAARKADEDQYNLVKECDEKIEECKMR